MSITQISCYSKILEEMITDINKAKDILKDDFINTHLELCSNIAIKVQYLTEIIKPTKEHQETIKYNSDEFETKEDINKLIMYDKKLKEAMKKEYNYENIEKLSLILDKPHKYKKIKIEYAFIDILKNILNSTLLIDVFNSLWDHIDNLEINITEEMLKLLNKETRGAFEAYIKQNKIEYIKPRILKIEKFKDILEKVKIDEKILDQINWIIIIYLELMEFKNNKMYFLTLTTYEEKMKLYNVTVSDNKSLKKVINSGENPIVFIEQIKNPIKVINLIKTNLNLINQNFIYKISEIVEFTKVLQNEGCLY